MLAGLVLGLLDTSRAISNRTAASIYRSWTLSWSRYGYQGVIIERDSVDRILSAALAGGYRYCLIQPYGCVLAERWRLDDQRFADFFAALESWTNRHQFFVAGRIDYAAEKWYGLEPAFLLIDLHCYRRLGAPRFDLVSDGLRKLPRPEPIVSDGRLHRLDPTAQTEQQQPALWGWNAIRSGLEAALPILTLDDDVLAHTLDLEATDPRRRAALLPYLGDGILRYDDRRSTSHDLSAAQQAFLDGVKTQTANARRGVFLWNIESYADIETPRDDFQSPVSTLYCVAAGFKPNRMLQTHGFDAHTRVVYFDYSQAALDVRRFMVEQWDGVDFPRFVRRVFQRFPSPQTFYQLWDNATADTVSDDELDFLWQRELQRWGGSEALRDHWQQYARLAHEYVCCDVLTDPSPLLARMASGAGATSAMIWWSNAFFTMYGNWFHTVEQRQRAYERWSRQLAEVNPGLYLFGSDFNNTNVNFIQAGEYWEQYCQSRGDCLVPRRLYRTELRM
jgi:hypothetical protein